MSELTKLSLGADTVTMLLPHRRPFLFLDGVRSFGREPRPTLTGHKQVSINEPVFDGHFPGLSIWPGVYTIEGLGQTVNALIVLLAIVEGFVGDERTEAEALDAIRAIDARHRLGRRAAHEAESRLLEQLGQPTNRVGLAGAIDVKLIEPVFAGCTLEYRVVQTHSLASARRFDVLATVDQRPVAQGSITSSLPPVFPT